MPVVTISRQYASGGSRIAQMVATRLGWTLIDNEFVDRVAERVGLPPEEVARREERLPGLVERLANTLTISSPELFLTAGQGPARPSDPGDDLVRMTEAVIDEAAAHDVVLVGRGGQACLARRDDALHVRIVAPRADRTRTAAKRLNVSLKEAERAVDRTDEARRAYVNTHYNRDWADPANYHLVVNSAKMSYEDAADLIVQAVRRMTGGKTEGRKDAKEGQQADR